MYTYVKGKMGIETLGSNKFLVIKTPDGYTEHACYGDILLYNGRTYAIDGEISKKGIFNIHKELLAPAFAGQEAFLCIEIGDCVKPDPGRNYGDYT
jgi:hypothetical protein